MIQHLHDFQPRAVDDARQAPPVFAPQNRLLAFALHVNHRVHVQHALALRVRHNLLDLHGHGVRQLVVQPLQRGLADQLGHAGIAVVVGHVVVRVELRPFRKLVAQHVQQHVQLHLLGGGNRHHVRPIQQFV